MAKVKIVEYIGEGSTLVVSREIHFDEVVDFLQYELREEPMPTQELEVGKEYRVIGNSNGHEFKVGDVVRITRAADAEDEYTAEYLDGSEYWYVVAEDLEEI